MNEGIERILELAEITGHKDDPAIRAILRRLALRPDSRLAGMVIRQLTAAAGDEAFDPSPFRTPTEEELAVPGTEEVPYVAWGRVARVSGDAILPVHVFLMPVTCEHCLFTGMARKGKSVAVAQMLRAILR